jgi:uncharacterized protein (DUF2336 family)
LAKNGSVGIDILTELTKDRQAVVRKALCQAPKLPKEILKALGDDENETVIEEIFKRTDLELKDLEILSECKNWRARALVTRNENVTLELLLKLAGDEEKRVKLQMAKRSEIPDEVVLKLIFGETSGNNIRKLILKKELSDAVLVELAKNGDNYIKKMIVKKENLPAEAVAVLSQDENEEIRSKLKAG